MTDHSITGTIDRIRWHVDHIAVHHERRPQVAYVYAVLLITEAGRLLYQIGRVQR